jgi:hypothetical protein
VTDQHEGRIVVALKFVEGAVVESIIFPQRLMSSQEGECLSDLLNGRVFLSTDRVGVRWTVFTIEPANKIAWPCFLDSARE